MSDEPEGESRLVEMLAAGVAHEVRNPLTSVLGDLGILERELRELLAGREAHAFTVLGGIAAEVRRLHDRVSEFLRFARSPDLHVELVELPPLLSGLAAFLTPEFSKKGVGLELDQGGPDVAHVDGFRLKQAVLDLVRNALQATPAGGHVTVRTRGDRHRLLVIVVDDGEGMAEETRKRAGTPFFTTRQGGTGLGLALVRRIMEQHGGTLDIFSAPGRGTTATLVFPGPRAA